MNTIKEATKQSSWSLVKHSILSELYSWFYNYTKQELQDDNIYISYVVGQDKPTLSYVMHLPKQANMVFLRNHQMNFLIRKTMPKAVEAIEGNFELYPDKEKFLNFFQYEIPSFISRNKLKGINKETLMACLQWIERKKSEEYSTIKNSFKIDKLNEVKDSNYLIGIETSEQISKFQEEKHPQYINKQVHLVGKENTTKQIIKLIQIIDLLGQGTPNEKKDSKPKLKILKYKDEELAALLSKIDFVYNKEPLTIIDYIKKARDFELNPISEDIIDAMKKHFEN